MLSFDITRHVPKFILNDKNGYAIAKAIEAGLRYMNKKVQEGVDCITNIDTMPEWRLDELAREYNIYYDFSQEIEIKRRWIKEAVKTYAMYGTPGLLRNMIAATFGDGEVFEWFDYDGKPYHFKVSTESILDENKYAAFYDLIQHVKNVRSVFDSIETEREVDQNTYIAAYMYQHSKPPTIIDGYSMNREEDQRTMSATAMYQAIEAPVIADGYAIARERRHNSVNAIHYNSNTIAPVIYTQ